MAIKDGLLAEFDHETATTKRLLERVPEASLAWKPHEKSMSLGGLSQHIANLPNWGVAILEQTQFDMAQAPPRLAEPASCDTFLRMFAESTAKTRRQLDRTDGELMAMWSLRRGDQEIFSLPRVAAFRSFVLNHMIHHRGQLSVYLRLRDVPVPPIYGPTADEG